MISVGKNIIPQGIWYLLFGELLIFGTIPRGNVITPKDNRVPEKGVKDVGHQEFYNRNIYSCNNPLSNAKRIYTRFVY